ncbi:MAG TPA: Txe/YoeB family addiction module toxin [Longimicrobium sp.]|nr:Txe/YoeB family addiction module toxin [Longimicrobium sp.]
MSAAKGRELARHETSPAVPDDERQAIVLRDFRADLAYWIGSDPRIASRVMRLIEDVLRNPFSGLGKPEPMKYEMAGKWSRRITDVDRLVYTVTHLGIYFSRARHHYQRR